MSSFLKSNNKEDCTGCASCKNICPKQCINMEYDEEGFLYPNINKDKCVNCKMCIKVCPLEKEIKKNEFKQEFYALKNKDIKIREKSSSGGVFIPISNVILEKSGIVFGAKFDKDFYVIHEGVSSSKDRDLFCQSKYLQSDINDTYKKVKEYLNKNKIVLFTGTPCQIDGLNNYLGKDFENLITLDFVCHGVPSPKVFQSHIKDKIKKYKSKIKSINFRYKKEKWGTQNLKIIFENGKVYSPKGRDDKYYELFASDIILRKSCYKCKYSNLKRVSDITIADFWGINTIRPNFDDGKGSSLVIINSIKGKNIFELIKSEFQIEECSIEEARNSQYNLRASTKFNKKRDKFFDIYINNGYKVACIKCITIPEIIDIPNRIVRKIKYLKNKN